MDGSERTGSLADLADEVGSLGLAVAQRMLGSREEAEDALQDAYVQALRGLPGFRGDSSMRTWFLRILVNACRRHRVIARRWLSTAAREAAEPVREGAHTDVHPDPALRQRLERAVLALPFRQRTAFVLRYGQDLGIEEISAIMGCAQGTVKATLHKAVMRLRSELADLERGDP